MNNRDSVWFLQVLLVLRGWILKNAAKQTLVENKDIVCPCACKFVVCDKRDKKYPPRFSYAADRCDKLVFPASIPAGNQLNMLHDKSYRTVECKSAQGLKLCKLSMERTRFSIVTIVEIAAKR